MSLHCAWCGDEITYSGRGRPPAKYCSRKCKESGRQRERRAAAVAAAGERRCLACGAVIPESVTLKAKCCSRECGVAWQNQKRAEEKRARVLASRKPCPQCGGEIPDDRRGGSVYCSYECKKKANDAAWRIRSPHYMREYNYGLSQERFEAMLAEQDSRCAICRSPDWPAPIKSGIPQLDHDHGCDQGHAPNRGCPRCARGLLCGHCNTGIGHLGHDPVRLRAAAEYLERYQE